MSDKEDAAFAKWVKEFEATTLADETPEVKAAFAQLASGKAGREVYRGFHRTDDYYRKLNEHAEKVKAYEAEKATFDADKAKMWGWWDENQPKVETLKKQESTLKAQLAAMQSHLTSLGVEAPELTAPASGGTGQARIEEMERRLAAAEQYRQLQDRALPKLLGDLGDVMHRAQREGYNVPPSQVLAYAMTNNTDATSAFNALTAEERTSREGKALEEKLKAAEEKGAREALAKASAPSRIGAPSAASNDSLAKLFGPTDAKQKSQNDKRSEVIEAMRQLNEASAQR